MIRILGACGDDPQANAYRSMFAARKSVFVDLLKWDVPVLASKYELDQFDDEHATYLIIAEDDGTHLGSCRLLPTVRPHILNSLYPELCDGGVPSGPDILEVTRFCLDRRLSAHARRLVRDTLVTMLAEYAVAEDIRSYSALAELRWSEQIRNFGWRCALLGPPRAIVGKLMAALRIDIDHRTLNLLEACGIKATTCISSFAAAAAAA